MAAKLIRALLGFVKVPDGSVLARALAVLAGLTGNAKFPNPPVDLIVFKTTIDNFQAAITEALDGSKKAKAAKNNERASLIKMLRQLAVYVEANSNEDMSAFASSGFEPAAAAGRATTAEPLTQPGIKSIVQGSNSGQLVVRITSLAKARSYELHYAPLVNGAIPTQWTTVTLTSVRGGVEVDNLAPGTNYAFQVRALGNTGYTDWSDIATRMSI